MLQRIWPIAAVVLFNTLYNICAKSTPENVNAFASLFLTYVTAALGALGMFFCTGGKGLFENFGKANWTAYLRAFTRRPGSRIHFYIPCRLENQCCTAHFKLCTGLCAAGGRSSLLPRDHLAAAMRRALFGRSRFDPAGAVKIKLDNPSLFCYTEPKAFCAVGSPVCPPPAGSTRRRPFT